MHIKSVEFAGAVARPDQSPPGRLPQIAFSGRSNVGKSSLINRLLGRTRTQMARVSSTPGKTREINFYKVRAAFGGKDNEEFFLVDLPGYGFARVPVHLKDAWRPLIEGYLKANEDLRGVVQLVDARHGLTADDHKIVNYLSDLQIPSLFALTKIDRLTRSERAKQIDRITKDLGVDADQVVPFSSKDGEGREELLETLGSLLAEQGGQP